MNIQSRPHSGSPLRSALTLLIAIIGISMMPARALAQATPNPPARMTYQGFLVGSDGVALGNAAPKNYDVIFTLYNSETASAAGNILWGEQQTVTVDKGYFSILLGEGAAVSGVAHTDLSGLFRGTDASDRYVGITVKGIGSGGANVDITPRLRLLSSPYAFLAQNAIKLVQNTGADLITASGNAVTVAGPTTVNNTITATGTVTAPTVTSTGAVNASSLSVSGAASVGSLTSAGAVNGASSTISGTLTAGTLAGFGTIPLGGIIMWSGSVASIPAGWALCNGQTSNGRTTPNLQDRFVIGAGSGYSPNGTGGNANITLSVAQLPPHHHTFTDYYFSENNGFNNHNAGSASSDNDNNLFGYGYVHDTQDTGSGSAINILPPYYALAFIMRVQ